MWGVLAFEADGDDLLHVKAVSTHTDPPTVVNLTESERVEQPADGASPAEVGLAYLQPDGSQVAVVEVYYDTGGEVWWIERAGDVDTGNAIWS